MQVGWRTDLILVEMLITLMVVSKRLAYHSYLGRGDRAVEGARLEIVCTPNKGIGSSNPPLSAIHLRLGYALNAFILKTLHEQLGSFPCCSLGLRSPPLYNHVYKGEIPFIGSRRFRAAHCCYRPTIAES